MEHQIPPLYKLCDRKFNLALQGNSIRLGKLSFYRSFEKAEIGDVEEGIKSQLGYINDQTEKIPIHHFSINDSLIFSSTTELDGKISDYNSCYKITDPVRFSLQVGDCILDHLNLKNMFFSNLDRRAFTLEDMRMLDILIQRRAVHYTDPAAIPPVHYEFGNIQVNEPLYDMHSIAFWKNLTYASQKEFRLTFDVFFHEENGTKNYALLPFKYLDVNLSKYRDELPVELVY